tara:strand:+ start:252 stop:503 length:252 start_codon:yes stop_codon:yes gene_type:complete
MARDYKKEYANYHSQPKQIANRSSRNAARRAAVKTGKVSKGDGLDLHHVDGNPQNNKTSNLRALKPSSNRSFARTKTARKARG